MLGISIIVFTIPWIKALIFSVGICFLVYMGWVTWRSQSNFQQNIKPLSTKSQIVFSASVSLLNPHALLDTIAVIGTNSLNFPTQSKCAYTIACILVSFCWFLLLSLCGHFLNKIDKTRRYLLLINKTSAMIMWFVASHLCWQLVVTG